MTLSVRDALTVVVVSALVHLPLVRPAQAQVEPTAQFTTDTIYVLEDVGFARIEVELVGTVVQPSSISYRTADDDATIDDYVDTGGGVTWQPGETGTRTIQVEIWNDQFVESDESFFVNLSPASDGRIQLGDRTQARVIILDDDSSVRAYFPLEDADGVNGRGAAMHFGDTASQSSMRVRLTGPAPPGFEVAYQIDDGPVQTLPVSEGAMESFITFDPVVDGSPGLNFGLREIRLIANQAGRRDSHDGLTDLGYWLYNIAVNCPACVAAGIGWSGSGDPPCPPSCDKLICTDADPTAAARAAPDWVSVLRGYRDQVLSTTSAGQFYTNLYGQLGEAITETIFDRPQLFFQFLAGAGEWIPAFDALSSGNGDGFVVSANMESTLNDILDTLESADDPDLRDAVQRERTRLMLGDVAGLSMDELQARLELLGGELSEKSTSFGRLKTRFDR